MRASALKYRVLWTMTILITVILVLIPLHAFLTVSLASIFGHYTAIRLWKEMLLLLCIIAVLYLILADGKVRSQTLSSRLAWVALAYVALNVVLGLLALHQHTVTAKALGYGWISDLRLPIFFLVTWAVTIRTTRLQKYWRNIALWPAAVVIVFGLLQAFVLPRTFLQHFGYGPSTIAPYETINHNQHYLRIGSTLRGANPLGAYLIIPLSLLAILIATGKRNWQNYSLMAGGLIVLFFSFSRSAWIGALLSLAIIAIWQIRLKRTKQIALGITAGFFLVAAAVGIGLRHNTRFQNLVLHTQSHSQVSSTSNAGHLTATKKGLEDMVHHPWGNGPGSAGPASVYNNNHPPRIAEDYYIQIGQETGWLGLVLFLIFNAGVGYLLWLKRADPLALSLFASLIGLTFVNLLSHAWADDTLAYVWWGLAGIAMAPLIQPKANEKPLS